ncbi:RHS repeat domain-containing protein [Paenibacillus filicis]|uniref:RHS repeat domain-containing protein n=1 Tax=Paenibacillus filicis TaxID=669464 RepID=A0ABU9DKN9_9BACL
MARMKSKFLIQLLVILCCFAPSQVYASSYTYDELDRLTSATLDSGETILYTYDPAGNILSVRSNSQPAQLATFTGRIQPPSPGLSTELINGDFEMPVKERAIAPGWEEDSSGSGEAAYMVVKLPSSKGSTVVQESISSSVTRSVYVDGNVSSIVTDSVYGNKPYTTQAQQVSVHGNAGAVASVKQEIYVTAGVRYELTAAVLPVQLNEASVQLAVSFYDNSDGLVDVLTVPVHEQTSNWQEVQAGIQVPDGAVKAKVALQLHVIGFDGTGHAIFDDIVLKSFPY